MKQIIIISWLLILSSGIGIAQKKNKKEEMKKEEFTLKNHNDSVSYSLGANVAQSLIQQGFTEINFEAFNQAMKDVAADNKLLISNEEGRQVINAYFMNIQKEKADKNLAEGKKFLEENKKRSDVVTLPSGLQYQVLKQGNGPMPKATDRVTTHYHGTLINGTVFDSSVERGTPATFPVNGVIQGWIEALQLMNTGSKWRLFIPAHLAYGERGAGETIGPNATLIFDVELISIE